MQIFVAEEDTEEKKFKRKLGQSKRQEVVSRRSGREDKHGAGSAGEPRWMRWAAPGFHLVLSFEFVALDHAV